MVPVSPMGYMTFLSLFAEQILRLQYDTGTIVNLIIMVSKSTENYIRRYFEENNYFGLMRMAVFFLRQNENPRLDPDGDIIFDGEKIITTGDGHGGVYRALVESHLRDELIIRGVESVLMFNVDNPLARFSEPSRIGYHFARNADFTISAVEKVEPMEKIGVVALNREEDKYRVIEYNLLNDEMKNARDSNNNLLFSSGHINVNLVNLSVIDKRFPPIVYRDKKIKIREGQIPTSSLEWLNQDLIQVLNRGRVAILGLPREKYFLPTKNVKGVDSIESTMSGMVRYFKDILDDSCKFYNNSVLDISPIFISDERDNHRLRNLVMEEDSKLFIRANFDSDKNSLLLNKGIVLERGATLKIICKEPYGRFEYDYISNTAKCDNSNASLFSIKYPLKIKAGVSVNLQIEEGSTLIVEKKEISENTEITVKKGEIKVC